MFGTRVIPRDATVDPTLFSEEEYPVYCPKCEYLLRGLPDGKCPECGTAFERGRLLVRQYVVDWSGATWRRMAAGRWAGRLLVVGAALILLGFAALAAKVWLPSAAAPNSTPAPAFERVLRLVSLWIGVLAAGVSLYVAGAVLTFMSFWRRVGGRRAIIDAIK
jgi:hypothetical protein